MRVWHEARVLRLLGEQRAFDVPDLVTASPDPACLATRVVEGGVPLSYELVRASIPERVEALAAGLGQVPRRTCMPRRSLLSPTSASTSHYASRSPGCRPPTDELRFRFTPILARTTARACAPLVRLG